MGAITAPIRPLVPRSLTTMQQHARIYLVGAGPGDPDLLTVKALRLLQQADTVIYDRLVSSEIQRLIPEQAARIYVGKATCHHTLSQAEINTLLVEQADRHKTIIRLKGGDPYLFGRGGEEALALVRAGHRLRNRARHYRRPGLRGLCRDSPDPSRTRQRGALHNRAPP